MALFNKDIDELRAISDYFYNTNGVYQKACNYLAKLYRFDWYVVPEIYGKRENEDEDKIVKDFIKVLRYLDNSNVKQFCGDKALEVIKYGAYYGYKVETKKGVMVQDLPIKYCRSRFKTGGVPAIEFDMKFFDDKFLRTEERIKVLKLFPPEFKKGYELYRKHRLEVEHYGDLHGWYMLDPKYAIKFSLDNDDLPFFINAIPAILDLEAAQDLDRRKQMQKLLKIIVQKLPRDKNGDLIFDVDEAADLHNNAVTMLRNAVGVDVLTTFADVEHIDLSDNATASMDELEKVERSVFNALGISQNLFNTDGNLSLERSVLVDEGSIRSLIHQFNNFFDNIVQSQISGGKRYGFRFYMLETTQINYKDLSKMYKEQVQIGYSKMLPQIALGHSQSAIINTAFFENQILHLSEIMIPPLSSNTMNPEALLTAAGGKTEDSSSSSSSSEKVEVINTEENKGGRPEKSDSEKSDKTIANRESMG